MKPHVREPIVIACAADGRYAIPLAVLLQSALTSLSSERSVAVYVLDAGIQELDKRKLADSWKPERATIHWLETKPSAFSGLPLWGRMPAATYSRLLLGDLLPPALRKVIWLDCDMVVKRDLARLWDTDVGGHHALAVQDMLVPHVSSRYGVARWRELGLRPEAKYFNAGVMVVDLERWREGAVAARVMSYLKRHAGRVFFWDQEGLNVVLAGRWGELDLRWNQNASVSGRPFFRADGLDPAAYQRAIEDPWIVHFCGALKPWVYRNPQNSAHELFFGHLDQTPWAGWRPARSLRNRVLGLYESSRLRNVLYPLERLRMEQLRRRTLAVRVK